MAKSTTTITFLLILVVTVKISGQSKWTNLLTSKEWKFQTDSMKGTGSHQSLAFDTRLIFSTDGTWTCTSPLHGLTRGTWKMEKDNKVLLEGQGKEKNKTYDREPHQRRIKFQNQRESGHLHLRFQKLMCLPLQNTKGSNTAPLLCFKQEVIYTFSGTGSETSSSLAKSTASRFSPGRATIFCAAGSHSIRLPSL